MFITQKEKRMKKFFKIVGLLVAVVVVAAALLFILYQTSTPFRARVQYGGDLARQDIGGWNALHAAAAAGDTRMIDYVLGNGIDKNSRTGRGETAWHIAVEHGRSEAADLLAERGVDTGDPVREEITGGWLGQERPGDSPEIFKPGVVVRRYPAHSPCVWAPDKSEMYWTAGLPPNGNVEVMRRVKRNWTWPEHTPMKGEASFSPDGKRLFFISTEPLSPGRPGGDENIWVMDKTPDGWSRPVPLPPAVNDLNPHFMHSVDKAGNLYFSTYGDMYYSELKNGDYTAAIPVSAALGNETLKGTNPHISPYGDFLLFSARTGARGEELCVAFRKKDGVWTDKIPLGGEVNAGRLNFAPRLTPDGNYLFFCSAGNGRPWAIYWMSAGIIDRLKNEHVGITPPAPELTVRPGATPVIDGVFSPGEWDDAGEIELGVTRKMWLKHDGTHLYLAFSANGGNVYVHRDDRVHILHASYSLGRAEYTRQSSDRWALDTDYDWKLFGLQNKPAGEIHDRLTGYLADNGWTASLMPMGDPFETEYAISLEWLGISENDADSEAVRLPKIGISHMSGPAASRPNWPPGIVLCDSLDMGYEPATWDFDVTTWGDIYLGR
jgi:hypothetical protein